MTKQHSVPQNWISISQFFFYFHKTLGIKKIVIDMNEFCPKTFLDIPNYYFEHLAFDGSKYCVF